MKIKGFTLIELLVVISIIGVLAALVMVSFTASQRQARDTARKSDIKQYQTSLESYANTNGGLYPQRFDSAGVSAAGTLCDDMSQTTCPEDPLNQSDNTFEYEYQSDGTNPALNGMPEATKYVLWAKLENTTDNWIVCSSGKSGTKPQLNFQVAGGACPLD